jgi:hypothetical protein
MAAGMLKTRMKNRNHRTRKVNDLSSPIVVVSATKATNTIAIVFNQVVSLNGTPVYTTNLAGVTAISAVLTNPTTVTVTFSASVATATTLTVPFMDPFVRNMNGGYVNAGSFPVT